MNFTHRSWLWTIAFSLLTLPGALCAAAISRAFDVAPGELLLVDAEGARIDVHGGNGDRVEIDISRDNDDAADLEEDLIITFSQADDTVTLVLESRPGYRSRRSVDIDVRLPRQFNLDLKTSGGRVDIEGVQGSIATRTSGGDLNFADVDGEIQGRTSGGSIYLSGTTGSVDLRTSGGRISIGKVDGEVDARTSGGGISIEEAGGPVRVSTSGGNITLNDVSGAITANTSGGRIEAGISAQPAADSRITTSGGSITVNLQPGMAFTLDSKTSGGSIQTDLPVTIVGKTAKGRIQGDINGGGPELYLRTSGGSIKVRAMEAVPG